MGQNTIEENKGRRVRSKSLDDFLSLIEQNEQNLRKMTVSSAFRRDTQPELMMSMNCNEYDLLSQSEGDHHSQSRNSSVLSLAKDLLSQKQVIKSPAIFAAREALISQVFMRDSHRNSYTDSVSEYLMLLRRGNTTGKFFGFRSNPRYRTRTVQNSDPKSQWASLPHAVQPSSRRISLPHAVRRRFRRRSLPQAVRPKSARRFPSGTSHSFLVEELEKEVKKGMEKGILKPRK